MRSAMAPPARMERALNSSEANPTLVLHTDIHLLFWKNLAKGVWLVAPWCRRYATRHLMAATAHALGCPVVPWPIDFPLTPFFWVLNRRLVKVVMEHSCGFARLADCQWITVCTGVVTVLRLCRWRLVSTLQATEGGRMQFRRGRWWLADDRCRLVWWRPGCG